MKNGLDEQYIDLLKDILENGVEKDTRNGKTLSVFGRSIRYKFKDGKFPLLTTKKMAWKSIVTELLWFLRGDTNIKFLVDNNCHIWDGDAYKAYLSQFKISSAYPMSKEQFIESVKTDDEFAKKWGDLGRIYGAQWRNWRNGGDAYKRYVIEWCKTNKVSEKLAPSQKDFINLIKTDDEFAKKWRAFDEDASGGIDQIANLIRDLKTNPDSRRLLVTAWNPTYLPHQVLPPCHYGFQVYTRELSTEERLNLFKVDSIDRIDSYDKWLDDNGYPKRAISLMWNQRSVDTFLGLPFNIASYGLLLEIIAKAVNMVPDELIGNLGDTHLYLNHIEQAEEQIEREPYELPSLNINTEFWPYEGGECGEGLLDANALFDSFRDGNFCKCLLEEDIQLGNYKSHPTIKAPLSN